MSNIVKINFGKAKRLTGVLSLTLDGSKLEGVVLRRTNGSLHLQKSFSAALTLDPLTAAPELVAREIRNQLDSAGIRERNCIFGLPLKWVLTNQTELPQLPPEDAASLLQMEVERNFPSDIATMRMSDSRCSLSGGKQYITFAGVSVSQINALENVLEMAKLKLVSFSLGLPALQSPASENSNGVMALSIGESHVGLQITAGGGIAALRALEGAVEHEGVRLSLNARLVSREARVTLGQLPDELRATVKTIRIFGPRDLGQQLADEMHTRYGSAGMRIELVSAYAPGEFGLKLPMETPVSAALALAARRLAAQPATFEFLLPKPTLLQQFATKYSSGKLKTGGLIGALVALIVCGAFGVQQVQLSLLRSQWNKMSTKVTQLNALNGNIQQFKPWFDDTYINLSVMKQLTTAFPESGEVTAKTIEIRDDNLVTCSGTAVSQAAFLRMLSKLRTTDGVRQLKVESLRGKSPIQFTFNFQFDNEGK